MPAIVVGYDDSPGSQSALEVAASLAAEHGDLRGTAIPADWPTLDDLGITLAEAGEGLA